MKKCRKWKRRSLSYRVTMQVKMGPHDRLMSLRRSIPNFRHIMADPMLLGVGGRAFHGVDDAILEKIDR